jgi:hypothetical protein
MSFSDKALFFEEPLETLSLFLRFICFFAMSYQDMRQFPSLVDLKSALI